MKPLTAAVTGLGVLGVLAGLAFWALRDDGAPPTDDAAPPGRGPAAAPVDPDPEPGTPTPAWPAAAASRAEAFAPASALPATPIPEPGEAVPGRGLRFRFAGHENAELVDWLHVGIAVRRGQGELRVVVRRAAEGDETQGAAQVEGASAAILDRARPFCGPLFAPGTGSPVEGPIGRMLSHPVFESNALAGTLDAWGLPLTDEQVRSLEPVWAAHLARTDAASAGSRGPNWTLAGYVDVTRSRLEVESRLAEVLTPVQRTALRPAETRGRIGFDLFTPVTVWRDRVTLVPAPDDETLGEILADAWIADSQLEPPPARDVAVREFREWVRQRPASWRRGARGTLSRAGYVTEDELLPGLLALPEVVGAIARASGDGDGAAATIHPFRRAPVPERVVH